MTESAFLNVRAAFKRNIAPSDSVVIVLDDGMDQRVGPILHEAARDLRLDPQSINGPPVGAPNAEPEDRIARALVEHDVAVLAVSVPISHTAAVRTAAASGTRFIVMDGVSLEMLSEGAASADYSRVHEVGLVLERLWNDARHVRVESEEGTAFEADITGRSSWRWDGSTFEADWFSITGCAFPDGEVGIAPLEGSGQGTVVWDASVHSLGLLDEPIRLTVENGWITRIDGGAQARRYAALLESLDDSNSYYCPAEIAIGINEKARITGTMREDKKAFGTVHIASGTNLDIGGTIEAKSHIDGLMRYPSLWLDGDLLVDRGQIVSEVLP